MRVQSLSVNSPRVFEKHQRCEPIFQRALSEYFETRTYGHTVSKIQYVQILVPDEFDKSTIAEMIKYIPEEGKIVCIVQPVYKNLVTAGLKKYGKILADEYLNMTDSFSNISIDNFDCKNYREDLARFFELNGLT